MTEAIIEHHDAFGKMSPVEVKTMLEVAGYDIQPLGNKSKHVPNISFEDGGGFWVLFGGDANFRYHPKDSIHKIAYWTISNGTYAKHKYRMDGKEVSF